MVTDERIILSLLETGDVQATAEALHIKPMTIYNRRRKESFRRRFDELRDDMLTAAADALKRRMMDAIMTLDNTLKDPEASPQVRLNAAQAILSHGLRYGQEANIIQRVERLEDAVNDA